MNVSLLHSIILRIYPASGFLRSVSVVMVGNVASYALLAMASPVLTRLYSPDEFGKLSVMVSAASLLCPIITLSYEKALPIASNGEAANLIALSLCSIAINLSLIVIGYSLNLFSLVLESVGLTDLFPLLVMQICLLAIANILVMWALREKAMQAIAANKLSLAFTSIATQLGLALSTNISNALIIGDCGGRAISNIVLMSLISNKLGSTLGSATIKGIIKVAIKFSSFPKFLVISGFLNGIAFAFPPFFVTYHYGLETAGILALTTRLLGLPAATLGDAVGKVYWSEMSERARQNPGSLKRFFKKNLLILIIATSPAVIPAIFAPYLFAAIFGSNWSESGVYFQILVAMYMLGVVSSPLSSSMAIFDGQRLQMFWDILRSAAVIGIFSFLPALGYSARLTLAIYSLAMCLFYLAHIWVSWIFVCAGSASKLKENGLS